MDTKDPRDLIDHLMSRGVLGSMLVGTGVGKVVEHLVVLATGSTVSSLIGWSVATVAFVSLYVFWADFSDYVTDAAEDATEALEDSGDG